MKITPSRFWDIFFRIPRFIVAAMVILFIAFMVTTILYYFPYLIPIIVLVIWLLASNAYFEDKKRNV